MLTENNNKFLGKKRFPILLCSPQIPFYSMWIRLHWDRFFSKYFNFPLSVPFHQFSKFIFHSSFFTLRRGQCPPVYINQTVVPQAETVKYLGLNFDKRLTWKNHVATKRKQLDQKTREIYWFIGKYPPPLSANKLLMYKAVLKPVCGRTE
jgi:hypothetical protein